MNEMLSARAVVTAAALTFAAGCSGGSAPVNAIPRAFQTAARYAAPVTRLLPGPAAAGPIAVPLVPPTVSGPRGWPDAKRMANPILFVADLQGNVVRLYDPNTPNPSAEGSITNGISNPQGIAVDSKGSLYVSNVGSAPAITVYSPGKEKPRLRIPTTGYYGIAVDSKGDIFGTNVGGTVVGYRPGKKKPFETIGGFSNPVGIAVDGKNNVWVSDDSVNKVYVIAAGTKQVKDAGLTGLDSPIGLSFGNGDVLYVANFANRGPSNVKLYPAGSKKPSATITNGITGPTLNGITADDIFFQSNQLGVVVGYKKGQKTPFSTITGNSDPLGIASSPMVKK